MLNIIIFLPLLAGLALLPVPRSGLRPIRWAALAASVGNLVLILILWVQYDTAGPALQSETRIPWIPGLGASYHVAVTGISLPLIVLTTLLMSLTMIYVLPQQERAKEHAFLFLLMQTGLIGLFSAQDLLLFYLFFEVGLVPMYFIIGIFGHEHRRYAAVKFFLYTRAGSLFMLLSFLGIYLGMSPHTFSLPEIIAAQPLAGRQVAAGLAFLGLLIGFGVKIPIVPIHNWLPDAHVEAPTEGSVVLAGIQLKMGGYGLIAVMLPVLPDAVRRYGWVLLVIAVISLIYGALAALAQSDFKRLVAYTSVNHMGWVTLGAAVWALSDDPAVRRLAVNGAVLQMVSHGLLTGGMFFMAGILQSSAGTRELSRFGGLMRRVPLYSALLGLLAFGSLGLPGFSGFAAEFQVVGATVVTSVAAAVLCVLALVVTTGLYLKVLMALVMGSVPVDLPPVADMNARELTAVVPLAALSLVIGIVPHFILTLIDSATRLLVQAGVPAGG